jgi:hypothetical protein
MTTWIEEHKDEIWNWITGCDCFYNRCPECPFKNVCDEIWNVVLRIIEEKNNVISINKSI